MKQVKKGESIPRTAKVEGNEVWFEHLTLNKPSDVHYALRTGFDFTGVPQGAILRLAGETLLIRWRTAFKNATKIDGSVDNQLNSVAKMLSAARKPRMTKNEVVTVLVKEMTSAERIALLQQLQQDILERQESEEEQDEGEQA